MEEFMEFVKSNFENWYLNSKCNLAIELNKKIGEEYFCESNPHFFTGDLNADLVLIHLNPKRNKNKLTGKYDIEKSKFDSFDSYFDYFRNFGKYNYGPSSERSHKSPFDKKQIKFINQLNLIPLNGNDAFKDLENVIDKKLQLELIPFGSENFNYNKIGIDNIKPFINNLLSIISSKKRKQIIFCGRVFEEILKSYIIENKTHTFKLTKKDGSLTKNDYQFIEIKINFNNKIFDSVIAPQYATQGMPLEEYGRKYYELFN